MKKILLASVLTLFMSGCCVHDKAIVALDRGIAANTGHMNDTALPQEARDIAQDNYDLDNQIKFNLDGTPVPADTAERVKARADAAAPPADGASE